MSTDLSESFIIPADTPEGGLNIRLLHGDTLERMKEVPEGPLT